MFLFWPCMVMQLSTYASTLFFSVLDEKLSHTWIQIKKKNNLTFDVFPWVLTEQIEDWNL